MIFHPYPWKPPVKSTSRPPARGADAPLQAADSCYVSSPEGSWLVAEKAESTKEVSPPPFASADGQPVCGSAISHVQGGMGGICDVPGAQARSSGPPGARGTGRLGSLCTGHEDSRSQLPRRTPSWRCTDPRRASCLGASAMSSPSRSPAVLVGHDVSCRACRSFCTGPRETPESSCLGARRDGVAPAWRPVASARTCALHVAHAGCFAPGPKRTEPSCLGAHHLALHRPDGASCPGASRLHWASVVVVVAAARSPGGGQHGGSVLAPVARAGQLLLPPPSASPDAVG